MDIEQKDVKKYPDNTVLAIFIKVDDTAPVNKLLSQDRIPIDIVGQKIEMLGSGAKLSDLNSFEKVFQIPFDAKFYKYVDEFLKDLHKAKIKLGFRISSDIVYNILKNYGDFSMNDLLKSKLFDDDDFKVKWYDQKLYFEL